jgi:hypothetical protein
VRVWPSVCVPWCAGGLPCTHTKQHLLPLTPPHPHPHPHPRPHPHKPFNPVQARSRVDQLLKLGHVVDKVEFILMGGTFLSLPADYRDYFIRNLHDALSGVWRQRAMGGGEALHAVIPNRPIVAHYTHTARRTQRCVGAAGDGWLHGLPPPLVLPPLVQGCCQGCGFGVCCGFVRFS